MHSVVENQERATSLLREERSLPTGDPAERVVFWKMFRDEAEATEFSKNIKLGEGQQMVGGRDCDDVGHCYWLGVQVDDVAAWGNVAAIQKHDGYDGEEPSTQGRGPSQVDTSERDS